MLLCSLALVLCFFIVGGLGLAYVQPRFIIDFLASSFPEVLFTVNTSEKIIALTIDDAPTSLDTPHILDVLKQHNVTATFFCIGQHIQLQDQDRSLLQRMRDEGHEMGNHMWSDDPSYKLDDMEFRRQFREVDSMLEEVVPNRSVKWFRPGHGFFTRNMLDIVGHYGYRIALGDVYPHDPHIRFPALNSFYVLNRVHPGAVIILHDRPYTVQTLDYILPQLKAMGYTITTLSELIKHNESLVLGRKIHNE